MYVWTVLQYRDAGKPHIDVFDNEADANKWATILGDCVVERTNMFGMPREKRIMALDCEADKVLTAIAEYDKTVDGYPQPQELWNLCRSAWKIASQVKRLVAEGVLPSGDQGLD